MTDSENIVTHNAARLSAYFRENTLAARKSGVATRSGAGPTRASPTSPRLRSAYRPSTLSSTRCVLLCFRARLLLTTTKFMAGSSGSSTRNAVSVSSGVGLLSTWPTTLSAARPRSPSPCRTLSLKVSSPTTSRDVIADNILDVNFEPVPGSESSVTERRQECLHRDITYTTCTGDYWGVNMKDFKFHSTLLSSTASGIVDTGTTTIVSSHMRARTCSPPFAQAPRLLVQLLPFDKCAPPFVGSR
uniref:Peptidase A1 domain-containing protein n=1 Tax=Mycena chlorophos TaxID=658473 RepID=A0ABQ0KVA1_MYCCL|nr:predicted protein [Mycena chlorophos]